MNILQYFLMSILYFWASSTAFSLGAGYFTIYRPVITGLLTGVIFKNPYVGMAAGAVVNIIYMDFVSTGGSFKGDQCMTSIIAAICAIMFRLNIIESAAASYIFGFLGILIWKYRLNINSYFVMQYEKRYEMGKNPEINLYNVVLPQLLLYVMSTSVIAISFILLNTAEVFITNEHMRKFLFVAGLSLVLFNSFNLIYKLNNKKSILIFAVMLVFTLIVNIPSYVFVFASLLYLYALADKTFIKICGSADENYDNKILKKKDLVYSWIIWANYSHACYSFQRLQGLAFAHSMKNIFKKLYDSTNSVAEGIHRHSEFFNTEPNMGTPILGYIISKEEQCALHDDEINNTEYEKSAMMGIAAGLGDSFTQVVLTPLFISLSVALCMDGYYMLGILPVLLLGLTIITISYTGFMKGYFEGKESLMQRIKTVKNSKIKIYFPYIFSGILGLSLGKLIIHNYMYLFK